MHYNESTEHAKRELHFVINGKNTTTFTKNRDILLKGHRCDGPCQEAIQEVATENRTRYWSNAADWTSGAVPLEGEDVHVEPGWNMVFDLEDSPVYKLIRINGILTFKNESNCHLRAKHIFVRAGQLHIGSEEYPFTFEARITLYGEKDFESIVYDNAIEAGNKLLANVGLVRMFGIPRKQKMTRLLAPVNKGDSTFKVEPSLDLVAGDRLALAATAYDFMASDDVFVVSYDNVTGDIVINSTLLHYHWGAAVSTAA